MAFDQATRNLLARFVTDARRLIAEEFTNQFQSLYGISDSGEITPLQELGHLGESQKATAVRLRERIDYLVESHPDETKPNSAAVERLAREQAFTILNRLAAIRMAEKRGLIVESVGKGYQSKGFQVYSQVAGSGLGETYDRYRRYLFCLFDELAVDLGVLFDRLSPSGILFPREKALLDLIALLNAPDLEALWGEDETIGWIYQYYNDPAERKKMREKSAVPRNSYELAVRNQFFTPRYVVEFLTDNTLGRIWYEMTRGETKLKEECRYLVRRPNEMFLKPGEKAPEQPRQENLSQEELLKQPVYIPHRPFKDPREIHLLDPACGSMHFGLYAFDLFEIIYDEAWDLEETLGAGAFIRSSEMKSLHETYDTRHDFLKDVPRLIIEHNIHGIDIDPRCAQIAGLSLWLRAQKAWQRLGLKPARRPAIKRSNIVCAEPMPGDKELLREFVENEFPAAEQPVFAHLLGVVFDKMKLAGEAGWLLKIEGEIRSAIADAKKLWNKGPKLEQTKLFQDLEAAKQKELKIDTSGITDEQFWEQTEQRIYDALETYSEQAENGGGFQRRLFADDAAQGFAFIDVCRKRYDVAVMNPPFGLMGPATYQYAVGEFPNSYSDFGIAFIDRGLAFVRPTGFVGAITSRSYLSVADAEKFRVNVAITGLHVLADLGLDVMDGAWVDSSAQILTENSAQPFIQFVKARGAPLTPEMLQDTARLIFRLRDSFRHIPRARLSYEVEGGLEKLLAAEEGGLETSGISVNRIGASTFEDERFRRMWWEVNSDSVGREKTWCFVAKSCEFNLFYYPFENLVKWAGNGNELAERNRQVNEQTAQARQGSTFYFKPGLAFSRRGEPTIAFRSYPACCSFASNVGVVLPNRMQDALYLLGLLNSSWVRATIHTQAHKFSYTVAHPKAITWVAPSAQSRTVVEDASRRIIALKQARFRKSERDNHFIWPCEFTIPSIAKLYSLHTEKCERVHEEMVEDLQAIDRTIASVYSLPAEGVDWKRYNTSVQDVADPDGIPFSSVTDFTASLLSYFIGSVLGRWDIRYATGEKAAPELPDPFAPLPVCPPGQLQNAQGLPACPEDVSAAYSVRIPWDGILVDGPNHPLDIERRVREVIEIIWKDRAEAIEQEACEILGVKSLREYFRKPAGFFADHLKRYSKSRRQAPIYWPLSTVSGSYTLWIYYHRLTDQTLHTAIADFLDPKIKALESEIAVLRERPHGADSGKAGELVDFQDELKALRAELERVIKLPWKPNLNDGVLITASPLWKLFRLTKWQKDLKACWEALEEGDYDWAHLAYSIWPQRVEKLCETDRSVAIAHGLERLYKGEPPKTKKTKKESQAEKEALQPEL